MRCPGCDHQSEFTVARCPSCSRTFEIGPLEELGHLQYLRQRLERWQTHGQLSAGAVDGLLDQLVQEQVQLEETLGLLPPAPIAPVEARPAAAPERPHPGPLPGGEGVVVAASDVVPVGGGRPHPRPLPGGEGEGVARPAFSWADVGTSLLSERTLHALLGLGAFLILASGVVISTLNPTGLGPLPHLAAVLATTLLFYAAGYVVRQRLKLSLTGTALLAIGGAFIPLSIWTLGQEKLLNWDPGAIWLLASLLCLPLYLASHALLRDRTFGLLAAVAGGSELLALLSWLRLPLEWGLCTVLLLALGYLRLSKRLRPTWETLAWALFWTARVTTPTIMALLMLAKFYPVVYEVSVGRPLGGLYEYAVGVAWWLGTAFYATAARLFSRRRFAFAAAWALPFAYLFTLTKAPWEAAWYNLCLALLAFGYLGYGRWRQRLLSDEPRPRLLAVLAQPAYQVGLVLPAIAAVWPFQTLDSRVPTLYVVAIAYALAARLFGHPALRYLAAYLPPLAVYFTLDKLDRLGLVWAAPAWQGLVFAVLAGVYLLYGRFVRGSGASGYRELAREPLFQVALLLTLVAALWPFKSDQSAASTIFALAGVYAAAARLLGQRVWAYVGVFLLPVAYALLLRQLEIGRDNQPLAWAILAALLLGVAESAVALSGEARRPLIETVVGLRGWRARFASPLFSAGYLVSLGALGFGLALYWQAPAAGGLRQVGVAITLGLLGVVAILALSAVARRTSFFLHLATMTFLPPFATAARFIARDQGLPFLEPELARLFALLGLAYLGLARLTDRAGGHYAKPLYLAGYGLLPLAMLLSALDRPANVQVVGLAVLVFAATALQVHLGRHPSFLWVVERLFRQPESVGYRTARALFLYLACWLFPAWLLLALSLWRPPLETAHYGLALALLAPLYVALGLVFRRVRAEYRLPWYLAGYALSVTGPLVAAPDETLRVIALTISIVLYVASCVVFRRSAWLYPVALLLPILLWQSLDRLDQFARLYGIALVVLGMLYGLLGTVLHHGSLKRIGRPIAGAIGAYAQPFLVVSYALSAFGLARLANQERELLVQGYLVGALHYGGSALVLRQSVFGYPLVATLAVAYVVGLSLTPLEERFRGLALLPLVALLLAAAERMRWRLDTPGGTRWRPAESWLAGLRPASWSAPFYLAAYLGALAVPAASTTDQLAWAMGWWGLAAVLGISTVLFRHPLWLFGALGATLPAYLASLYAAVPELTQSTALAWLAGPAWLLLWSAYAVDRRWQGLTWSYLEAVVGKPIERLSALGIKGWPIRWEDRFTGPPVKRWAVPPLVWGWVTVVLAALGSLEEPVIGLRAALALAVLVTVLSVLRQSRAGAWAGLLLIGLAFQQGLRVAEVPTMDQPARWAVLALVLSVLAILLERQSIERFLIWQRPLFLGSIAAGVGAILWAVAVQLSEPGKPALQSLAATTAVTGLTLVAHAYNQRQRLLAYAGVALIEGGYMLQLVYFDVGQPQSFVLPAGLYLLAVAYLEWRRGSGAAVKSPLEAGALLLLLGISVIQSVGFLGDGIDRYAYATLLLIESVALFGLGAVLHWRKTFFGGGLALVLDVGILLADPLRAMNTWYLVAIIGLAMIGLVIFVEQRRQRIPLWLDEWRQRLESWD